MPCERAFALQARMPCEKAGSSKVSAHFKLPSKWTGKRGRAYCMHMLFFLYLFFSILKCQFFVQHACGDFSLPQPLCGSNLGHLPICFSLAKRAVVHALEMALTQPLARHTQALTRHPKALKRAHLLSLEKDKGNGKAILIKFPRLG